MTGDAPQPGETPRTEGNPWSFDPDAAWWRGDGDREQAETLAEAATRPRHPRRRPAPDAPASAPATPTVLPSAYGGAENPFLGETVEAHAAGVQDAAEALTPPAVEAPAEVVDDAEAAEAAPSPAEGLPVRPEQPGQPDEATVAVERDHDKTTRDRYDPPAQDEPDPADRPEGVPDVMVLPEPNRDRPTVPLERGAVPGQAAGPTRPSQTRSTELEVKRSRMENSPFWQTDEERAAAGPAAEMRTKLADAPVDGRRGQPPRRKPRAPRRAAPGLIGLIALGLVAAFFSWVSAEPFWLAVGHGDPGVATVARCTGTGVTQRCTGSFATADGSYGVQTVTLLGVGATGRDPGTTGPARMVNPNSRQAYVGTTGLLVHLRWLLGFALVLLCGFGIAGLTGTRQLETLRARRGALLMSVAGPLLLLAGFLFATY